MPVLSFSFLLMDMQVSTFSDMEGEETFDSSLLGYADEVVEERISDDDVVMIKGTKSTSAVCVAIKLWNLIPLMLAWVHCLSDIAFLSPFLS